MALIDNLVTYYKFDQTSGNATDSVGSLTATNVGMTYTSGKINNGASSGTSGANYFETTSVLSETQINTGWSIQMWLNFNALPGAGVYARYHQTFATASGGKRGFDLHYLGGTGASTGFGLRVVGATLPEYNSGVNVTAGTWNHVVTTYDGSTIKIYLNGTQILSQASVSFTVRGDALNTFTNWFASQRIDTTYAIGDEAAVWTRAINSTEVSQLYNAGSGVQHPFSVYFSRLTLLGVG